MCRGKHMNAVFNDFQEPCSPLDGATVRNREELFELLDSLRNRAPFVGELVGDNGYKLLLGIGPEVGSVQHSPSDGDVPYLMAVAVDDHCKDEYVEFLCGDTPSPISKRYCLPFESVKEIAAHFLETGERSPAVRWEEI
jgi:hypothetical protein